MPDLLEMLDDAGADAGSDYHDGLEGYFSWSIHYEDGFRVLKVVFVDYEDCDWETSGRDNEMPRYEKKYRLTLVEG